MNELLKKLCGGDLRSDGRANEVAEEVIKKPKLLGKLVEGLHESDDMVRARSAHALERISRTNPEMLQELTPLFTRIAVRDRVPMVKWHLAMIFGNRTFSEKETDVVISTLFHLLKDKSNFVKSWSISSLSILGREYKSYRRKIIRRIEALQNDKSAAIRTRAAKALRVLESENESIPATWSKRKKGPR